MKCFIYTGGAPVDKQNISFFPKEEDFVIAADSGIDNFAVCCKDRYPDIILGDMDSGNFDEMKKNYPNSEFIKLPCEKDDTDTSFAVKKAIQQGVKEIYIIGGIGSRLDHTVANAFLLKYIYSHGLFGVIDNGKNIVHYVQNGEIEISNTNKHKYLSIIPLCEDILDVTVKGVKYELEGERLSMNNSYYSVSNEISDSFATVKIGCGKALVIQSRD